MRPVRHHYLQASCEGACYRAAKQANQGSSSIMVSSLFCLSLGLCVGGGAFGDNCVRGRALGYLQSLIARQKRQIPLTVVFGAGCDFKTALPFSLTGGATIPHSSGRIPA